jgi:O-antigen/teichoic acid export membrane protein
VTTAPRPRVEEHRLFIFARNLGTRYALIVVNALIGLVVLPYNVRHLGADDYGLWMLAASVTSYFSVLELGYGGAIVKYVAEFRARGDVRGLNEVLSTMFFVFSAIGVVVYALAVGVSFMLPRIFNLEPGQAHTGQIVLLIIAINVALHFVFSVYGGVINGFERYYINNVVGTTFNVLTAAVNVTVLWLGYGLVDLVMATTVMRLIPYFIYRRNAHAVFPDLRIRWQYFNKAQLRELTGFSVFLAIIDWSSKLTFMTDTLILGVFLNTTVVGIYAVAQRVADALLRLAHQLHTFLFPAIVFHAVEGSIEGQRRLMVKATRFQLAIGVALCGTVAAVSDVLIRAWVGPDFTAAGTVLRLLALTVVLRAWMGMPGQILKGTGHHRYFAVAMSVCAVANLLLSILAVKPFGMVGVAWGTVIPVAVLAACCIFPRACRVVELPVARGYREVVWPAVWPAFVVVTLLAATRHALPETLVAVMLDLAFGGLLYLAIFFLVALPRDEREWFTLAINQVTGLRAPGYAALRARKSEA